MSRTEQNEETAIRNREADSEGLTRRRNRGQENRDKGDITKLRLQVLKIFLVVVAIGLVVGFLIWLFGRKPDGNGVVEKVLGEEGEVVTVSEVTLLQVLRTSSLYTAEYPYNGYATVYDGDKVKYYVAYEGTVKAGIDMDKVRLQLDKENKRITVILPEITIADPIVDMNSLECIFMDPKYEKEDGLQEQFKEATEDLKRKAVVDGKLMEYATESAKLFERALLEPWLSQMPKGERYDIVILMDGEEAEANHEG